MNTQLITYLLIVSLAPSETFESRECLPICPTKEATDLTTVSQYVSSILYISLPSESVSVNNQSQASPEYKISDFSSPPFTQPSQEFKSDDPIDLTLPPLFE